MDAIPVASQIKSFVQFVCKDKEGARITQENFSKQCPVVSQIRSAVEAAKGDRKAAEETQKEFGCFLLSVVEGVPVVGHIMGAGYYATKHKDKGDRAMKMASRTTGVIGGGVAGFFIGGPVGATVGGTTAGLVMDGVTSGVESAIHKEFKPNGLLVPFKTPKDPGLWVDAAFLIIQDSLLGRGAGKVVSRIVTKTGAVVAGPEDIVSDVTKMEKTSLARCVRSPAGPPGPIVPVLSLEAVEKVTLKASQFLLKEITKFKAQIFKWFKNCIAKFKKHMSQEFHDLIQIAQKHGKKYLKEGLTPENIEKIKNILMEPNKEFLAIESTKDQDHLPFIEDVDEPKDFSKTVLVVEEATKKGAKSYFFRQAEDKPGHNVVPYTLKRSRSCYF